MKRCFVNTANARLFYGAVTALEDRGAGEACLMIVDGVPGLGKTTNLEHWAARSDCLYVRGKKMWTPNWMLGEILAALGETQIPGSFQNRYQLILEKIAMRMAQAENQGDTFAIVIDEADFISRKASMLEALRDISDMLEVMIVFVGMGKIRQDFTRFPQVASRIGQVVRFEPLPLADVVALAEGLAEVTIDSDLLDYLHQKSGGLTREVKEGLSAIERFGKANGLDVVTKSQMDGQQLLLNRHTGQPVVVRV